MTHFGQTAAAAAAFATSLVAGFTQPASGEPLVDMNQDKFTDATAIEGGQAFTFDMGEKRVNWNHARWSVHVFDEPRDLSAWNALRIRVRTEDVRDDAGVFVAVREKQDGTWYYHSWAVSLVQAENTGVAHFDDFAVALWASPPEGGHFDSNQRLDLDAIDAVAIGTINPLGVGTLRFTVTGIDLINAEDQTAETVDVHVTGRMLDINGTNAVPAGLFGSFNLPKGHTQRYRLAMDRRIRHDASGAHDPALGDGEITHMMINTLGDRVRPSPRLTHGDWRERSERLGVHLATKARDAGRPLYVEYYNEPYLNWANRNRAGFINRYFDESKAEEGGPVHIKHDGQIAPHLRWTKQFDAPPWQWTTPRDWRRGRDEQGNVHSPVHAPPYGGMASVYGGQWQPQFHPPEDIADGEAYTAEGRELEAITPWHIYDETQFTYWSGRGMLMFYLDPMLAMGQALKQANSDAFLMVGWGFRPGEDHWAAWDMLYKPTIDAGIDIIDAVVDHDYGGSPHHLAAQYEVVTAYGMSAHDKWLYSVNTETAMGSDPQAYPDADISTGAQADRNKFHWTTTKLLHALQFVPDKARGFAWFGHGGGWWSDGGEGVAMDLLRNLRGRLVHVDNPDPHLYVAASVDGTDPLNPRPDDMEDRRELVVAVLNDHRSRRRVNLTVDAPAGTRFTEAIIRTPDFTTEAVADRIDERREAVTGATYRIEDLELDDRGIVVYTFPLEGPLPESAEVDRRQYFADAVLREVGRDEPAALKVAVDADRLASAERAWVRIVAERLERGEGALRLNGHAYPLPHAVTAANNTLIRQFEVAVDDLAESNEVVFHVADDRHAGYLLGAASIVLEGPTK